MTRAHDVEEVDINPVITGGPRTVAVDALIVLKRGKARECIRR